MKMIWDDGDADAANERDERRRRIDGDFGRVCVCCG